MESNQEKDMCPLLLSKGVDGLTPYTPIKEHE